MRTRLGLVTLFVFTSIAASEAPKITVNATGMAKLTPTALQVWVTLKEKAADAAGAVAALKASQEKMAGKLAALGVKGDQIHGELPTLVDKAAQDAMRQRRTGQRLKRKAADEKTEIEMQQMFRVLVPLTAKDLAEIVVEAETLKGKIKAAKLVEEKDAAEGDEDEVVQYQYDNQNAGPVSYVYFAPSGDEVQQLALADALKKAADAAARTAKAMGKGAVELFSVMVVADSVDQNVNRYYQYNRYGRTVETPAQDDGTTSATPQMSVYTQISAEFHFK